VLARQRQTQVLGWLELAREHLAAGEPAEAREACTQALALDPEHSDALQFLSSLDRLPDVTVARRSGGDEPAELPPDDSGYTVLVPIDRRPGAAIVPEAPPGVPSAYPAATLAPATAGAAAVASAHGEVGLAPASVTPVAEVAASRRPPARRRAGTRISRMLVIAVSTAVTLLVAFGVWSFTRSVDPGPPLMVVIDAAPWATVAAVEREGGEKEALPTSASTPLALSLVPGTYRVTLVGPPPASDRREVSVRVAPGEPSRVVLERFTPMTVDEYFSAYQPPAAAVPVDPGPAASGETP
jgi:hypothetical protein